MGTVIVFHLIGLGRESSEEFLKSNSERGCDKAALKSQEKRLKIKIHDQGSQGKEWNINGEKVTLGVEKIQ